MAYRDGIGIAIDAMIPGKKLVAYRAPGAAGAPSARLSVAPFVTPRAKGRGRVVRVLTDVVSRVRLMEPLGSFCVRLTGASLRFLRSPSTITARTTPFRQ